MSDLFLLYYAVAELRRGVVLQPGLSYFFRTSDEECHFFFFCFNTRLFCLFFTGMCSGRGTARFENALLGALKIYNPWYVPGPLSSSDPPESIRLFPPFGTSARWKLPHWHGILSRAGYPQWFPESIGFRFTRFRFHYISDLIQHQLG